MEPLFFVDTNVLLYTLDTVKPVKQAAAISWMVSLWAAQSGRVSWQVLQEFQANASKRFGMDPAESRRFAIRLAQWDPPDVNRRLMERAWHWTDHAQVGIWDSLIVAAAEQCGARWILSEDFQSGMRFGDITVVDPFAQTPADFGLSVPS